MALEVEGYRHEVTPMEEGWVIVRYVRAAWNLAGDNIWYYVAHCDVLCLGRGLDRGKQCGLCAAKIPEELNGFLNLCEWKEKK